jgi:hypothetical protein
VLTLMKTSAVNFTEVAVHYPGPLPAGTIFTVSSCGRFLMVANGCLLYVYELNRTHKIPAIKTNSNPGALRPVTSIICPRRVLACSMDTSSNRYAVAILLDGRMGIVCDINTNIVSPGAVTAAQSCSNSKNVTESGPEEAFATGVRGTSFLDRVSLKTSPSTSTPSHQVGRNTPVLLGIAAFEHLLITISL